MKNLIVFVLFNFIGAIAFCQSGVKQKLGNIAEITFPEKPTEKSILGDGLMYQLKYRDKLYLSQAIGGTKGIKDYLNDHFIDSIYDSYIDGNITQTKGTVFYKNPIEIDGLKGIEFGYTAAIKSNKLYSYQRAIYLNDTLLTMGVMSLDSIKNKHRFNYIFQIV